MMTIPEIRERLKLATAEGVDAMEGPHFYPWDWKEFHAWKNAQARKERTSERSLLLVGEPGISGGSAVGKIFYTTMTGYGGSGGGGSQGMVY
jgi:hypothetical protein